MIAPLAALLLAAAPTAPTVPTAPVDPPAERAAASHSAIDASVKLSGELASCLDHAVIELGLGAKKQGESWRAKGALVHATLATELNVLLRLEPADGMVVLRLHSDWPGAPKEAALQGELEARHIAAVTRAARICGVVHPEVTCRRAPAGAVAQPCTPSRS